MPTMLVHAAKDDWLCSHVRFLCNRASSKTSCKEFRGASFLHDPQALALVCSGRLKAENEKVFRISALLQPVVASGSGRGLSLQLKLCLFGKSLVHGCSWRCLHWRSCNRECCREAQTNALPSSSRSLSSFAQKTWQRDDG